MEGQLFESCELGVIYEGILPLFHTIFLNFSYFDISGISIDSENMCNAFLPQVYTHNLFFISTETNTKPNFCISYDVTWKMRRTNTLVVVIPWFVAIPHITQQRYGNQYVTYYALTMYRMTYTLVAIFVSIGKVKSSKPKPL